jgi:Skp family chaperone for outer membrane proteins
MAIRWALLTMAVLLALASRARADLKKALAEPNLEKRSQLALDNARSAYKAARDAYAKSDDGQLNATVAEILESVDLADASLEQTGKDARKHPGYFKKAEIETRDLARRLESFQQEMSYTERPLLDKVKARVQQVHDKLLLDLMGGKRK